MVTRTHLKRPVAFDVRRDPAALAAERPTAAHDATTPSYDDAPAGLSGQPNNVLERLVAPPSAANAFTANANAGRYATGVAQRRAQTPDARDAADGAERDRPRENRTGMPDRLKAGVESLSGLALDDVRVHYGSDKPAAVGALAYTQGAEIHVGPGQEEHLPHEAWHAVQQKQGRVKPTLQAKGLPVNDDAGLEAEADAMGAKAAASGDAASAGDHGSAEASAVSADGSVAQMVLKNGLKRGTTVYMTDRAQTAYFVEAKFKPKGIKNNMLRKVSKELAYKKSVFDTYNLKKSVDSGEDKSMDEMVRDLITNVPANTPDFKLTRDGESKSDDGSEQEMMLRPDGSGGDEEYKDFSEEKDDEALLGKAGAKDKVVGAGKAALALSAPAAATKKLGGRIAEHAETKSGTAIATLAEAAGYVDKAAHFFPPAKVITAPVATVLKKLSQLKKAVDAYNFLAGKAGEAIPLVDGWTTMIERLEHFQATGEDLHQDSEAKEDELKALSQGRSDDNQETLALAIAGLTKIRDTVAEIQAKAVSLLGDSDGERKSAPA